LICLDIENFSPTILQAIALLQYYARLPLPEFEIRIMTATPNNAAKIASSTLKAEKNELIAEYAVRNNLKAFIQTMTTILPYFVLFYLAIESLKISYWLAAGITLVLTLFIIRVFVMLHDCGHNCLYVNPRENKIAGFIFGVLCGVPQYVWSKHHDYHHSTNGNWEKYRGPLAVFSVDQYAELNEKGKKSYANQRNLRLAPLAGFLYFIFNPRFTWIKGSIQFAIFFLKQKLSNFSKPASEINADSNAEFKTNYWNTWQEYRHMTGNNLVLLSAWVLAASYFGTIEFFSIYIVALSLAGAIGIVLFTVQHNFEESYAASSEDWDYFVAALDGTSFLKLPKFLNWFTADIAYHHVHHLSARIPNYNLVKCHEQYKHLFDRVRRITLSEIPNAFKFIIWDNHTSKIISVEQYEAIYNTQNDDVSMEANPST
jgi:omega-6 fatty acid desaturase (delta-12 desaturase)